MGTNSSFPEGSPPGGRIPAFNRQTHAYNLSDSDLSAREKKKKTSKLTTLRKRLIRSRRHSRSMDYGKALREMIATWSIRELKALIQEYEVLVALKELAMAANLARPVANSLKKDLAVLFDSKCCTDIDLVYKGACFPAHRAILSVRSPYFRDLLNRYPGVGCQIPVKLRTIGVDVALFATVLRFLYTDEINSHDLRPDHQETLAKLADEFGVPNALEHDLRVLLDSGNYSDAVLVFTCDGNCTDSSSENEAPCKSVLHELRCHKAILAARSPFFKNLLIRRARSGEDQGLNTQSKIVLDETIIPRRYARVLLNTIYQDSVDLSLILRGSASMCSLSEVQAIVAGRGQMTLIEEAMEVYQIGQFLDFPVLSQGCEDIIAEGISLDNLISVLSWSSEPHGSKWVHNQALHFIREEFLQVVHSSVLTELSREYLKEALASDFLQAGELDILSAIIKWGENHLVKRLEEREPNLLSHTAHSISKKGVKKRDLNDEELKDILSDFLCLIRTDHILPHNSDVLNSAIKRGLVSRPPSHMIGDEGFVVPSSSWIRGKNNGMFVRPRLFGPYYEDAKAVLEERLSQGPDQESGRVRTIQMSSIPDTLYMVDNSQYPSNYVNPPSCNTVDIIAGTIPVPDNATIHRMLHRERELQSSPTAQRALSLPLSDRRAVSYQLRLRTVREFGLPDSTIEVLQNTNSYYPPDPLPPSLPAKTHSLKKYLISPRRRKQSPPLSKRTPLGSPTKPVQCVPPTRLSQGASRETDLSPCSDSALSDTMPDIAMASASLSQINLQDEFDLDIGDRGSHHGTLYI
ncbi:BTB/POZ domain-containing protein 7-like [Saccostrea echinata]|uniref:BTB/POZ domain-containing protein 7-like n=1 Tax=Saccostrea echinata TaxID=191078 RepID=UPI002A80CBC5|nr:BTB/POZ domain-containing protein 7-like [Saccostrea echinata]XP_061173069.1 BTB/POZ domain-containing protein 7-like [Saccostrea echinata]